MNKITRFLVGLAVLTLLLGSALDAKAQVPTELSEQDVQQAVQFWVRHVTADAQPAAVVERMMPHLEDGRIVGYVAYLQDGGFCLAGASLLQLPVYLYSPEGTYDDADPNLQVVFWEMAAHLTAIEKGLQEGTLESAADKAALAQRATVWHDLVAGRIPALPERVPSTPASMELSQASRWNQGSPYNDQTPNLTPGWDDHAVTGCVATAVAQVMYHWRWPPSGVGSHSTVYYWRFRTDWDAEPLTTDPTIPANWTSDGRLAWTAANGGRLRMNGYWDESLYHSARAINNNAAYLAALEALWNRLTSQSTTVTANYGATTYNWSVLQPTHTDPVDDGDPEVAKLMLHVGVAVDMDYGLAGSGSTNWLVPGPLAQFFRYDPDARYGNPADENVMVAEIQWLRPLVLAGTGPSGIHSWMVHGYNQNTWPWQFKMNMGWGGGSDGWYSLDNLPLGLNTFHNIAYQIAPQEGVKFVGAATAGDGSPDNPFRNIEQALSQVADGTTLIFKAGSDNTYSALTLTITRPMTLRGKDVTIRRQ